jgi:hypothetical protein
MNAEFRARLNLFQQPVPAKKKPRGGEARGAKGFVADGYFLAKISFAHCALWFDAELR